MPAPEKNTMFFDSSIALCSLFIMTLFYDIIEVVKKYLNIKNITRIAILGALGGFLMIIDFPIFVAPSFYKLDIGDLPCLIGAFAMGPIPAIFIQIIKILIKLLIKPTSTAFIGELASFIFSCVYCVSASIIYQRNRTQKGAKIAIIIGSIVMVLVTCIGNYLFIIPAYSSLYGMPLDTIIGLGKAIFPVINDLFSFVVCCVVPFNIIKVALIDILTLILYKHISPLLKD